MPFPSLPCYPCLPRLPFPACIFLSGEPLPSWMPRRRGPPLSLISCEPYCMAWHGMAWHVCSLSVAYAGNKSTHAWGNRSGIQTPLSFSAAALLPTSCRTTVSPPSALPCRRSCAASGALSSTSCGGSVSSVCSEKVLPAGCASLLAASQRRSCCLGGLLL